MEMGSYRIRSISVEDNPLNVRKTTNRLVRCVKNYTTPPRLVHTCATSDDGMQIKTLRRIVLKNIGLYLGGSAMFACQTAQAAMPPGFKKDLGKKRKIREVIDPTKFKDGPEGLKYFDDVVGDGDEAKQGSRVAVHFDAKWRGITFVTTRQGMGVTGGSPFGFDVGAPPGQGGTLKGLDLGVRGMRVGGQRKLIVPSALAYGERGYGEIPPNAELVIDVQLLSIKKNAIGTQVKLIEG